MTATKLCIVCNSSSGRLLTCIGVEKLGDLVHYWRSQNSLNADQHRSLKQRTGSTCKSGPGSCFHPECYGRHKSLSNAVNVFQGSTDKDSDTTTYIVRDPRHLACDVCLLAVLKSTDVMYTGWSEEALKAIEDKQIRRVASARKVAGRRRIGLAGLGGLRFALILINPLRGAQLTCSPDVLALMAKDPGLRQSLLGAKCKLNTAVREQQAPAPALEDASKEPRAHDKGDGPQLGKGKRASSTGDRGRGCMDEEETEDGAEYSEESSGEEDSAGGSEGEDGERTELRAVQGDEATTDTGVLVAVLKAASKQPRRAPPSIQQSGLAMPRSKEQLAAVVAEGSFAQYSLKQLQEIFSSVFGVRNTSLRKEALRSELQRRITVAEHAQGVGSAGRNAVAPAPLTALAPEEEAAATMAAMATLHPEVHPRLAKVPMPAAAAAASPGNGGGTQKAHGRPPRLAAQRASLAWVPQAASAAAAAGSDKAEGSGGAKAHGRPPRLAAQRASSAWAPDAAAAAGSDEAEGSGGAKAHGRPPRLAAQRAAVATWAAATSGEAEDSKGAKAADAVPVRSALKVKAVLAPQAPPQKRVRFTEGGSFKAPTTFPDLVHAALDGELPDTVVPSAACVRTLGLDAATVRRALAAAGLIPGAYPGAEWACDRFVACAGVWWWTLSATAERCVLPIDPLLVALAMAGRPLQSPVPAGVSERRKFFYPADMGAEDYALWLLPVNENNLHWWLLAVYPSEKTMAVYDSLSKPEPKRTHEAAVAMVKAHFGGRIRRSSWRVTWAPKGVPQQSDGSSCGYYVAEFGRRICTGVPISTPVSVPDTVRDVLGLMVGFNSRSFGQ